MTAYTDSNGYATFNLPIGATIPSGQQTAPPAFYAGQLTGGLTVGYGATCTGTSSGFNVMTTANYAATCSLATNNLDFGPVNLAANNDQSGLIGVTCSNGTAYSLALDGGRSLAASGAARTMTSGANSLTYGLYTDSGRSQPWGDGKVTSGSLLSGSGTGLSVSLPIYGRVPLQPSVPVGTYTDTITATVSY